MAPPCNKLEAVRRQLQQEAMRVAEAERERQNARHRPQRVAAPRHRRRRRVGMIAAAGIVTALALGWVVRELVAYKVLSWPAWLPGGQSTQTMTELDLLLNALPADQAAALRQIQDPHEQLVQARLAFLAFTGSDAGAYPPAPDGF